MPPGPVSDSVDKAAGDGPSGSPTACRRFRVAGRVQGVFFRASTQAQARQLRLTGYARNLPDGSVDVLACGDVGALDKLERWLRDGPDLARVDEVQVESLPYRELEAFTTG